MLFARILCSVLSTRRIWFFVVLLLRRIGPLIRMFRLATAVKMRTSLVSFARFWMAPEFWFRFQFTSANLGFISSTSDLNVVQAFDSSSIFCMVFLDDSSRSEMQWDTMSFIAVMFFSSSDLMLWRTQVNIVVSRQLRSASREKPHSSLALFNGFYRSVLDDCTCCTSPSITGVENFGLFSFDNVGEKCTGSGFGSVVFSFFHFFPTELGNSGVNISL